MKMLLRSLDRVGRVFVHTERMASLLVRWLFLPVMALCGLALFPLYVACIWAFLGGNSAAGWWLYALGTLCALQLWIGLKVSEKGDA